MGTLTQPQPVYRPKEDIPFGARVLGATGLGALIATVANITIYGGARLVGIPMRGVFHAELGVTVLPLSTVVTYSVLPALIGGAIFAILVRFFQRGLEVFLGIAAGFTLVSFLAPATVPQSDVATRLVLAVMLIIAAVSITAVLISAGTRITHRILGRPVA